jgi:branched-chain amino acid transport system substrate-binding protein
MIMEIGRRKLLKSVAATGVGLATVRMPAVHAQATPLKVGLLTVKTGPLAQGGIQMQQGIDTFLKQKNNMIAGRKVELVVGDTGGSPAGTKTKAIELVERDNVEILLGPLAAFEVLAITSFIKEKNIPLITLAAAEDITQRQANPWFVRTSASSAQTPHAMADFCVKELKFKTMATLANDFAYGHEQCAGFQRVFEDGGGKIMAKLWPPLVTLDYVPFVTSIHDVDGVFCGLGGSNPLRFFKTYSDFGLHGKIPVAGGWTLMDDSLLKSMGDEVIGVYSANWYTPDYDSPSNKQFIGDMQKQYGELPGGYAAGMYLAGQVMAAALEVVGGKTSDREALMTAIRAVSLNDTPRGPFRFDDLGNAIGNVFIRRCERKDGKLVNTTIKTYENVSQFWTYDEKAFLTGPVYSRNYPQ